MMATTTVGDVEGSPHYYTIRQAAYGAIGIVLMLLLARIDYSRFRELRFGLYAVMLACITAVLLLGATTRGSQRWIELPFFTFQPSELGKVLLIVALAAFVIERSWRASELQRTARLLLVGALPAALVLLQPDLGTAMVYVVITVTVLFISGVRWTHFAALGGVSAAVTAACTSAGMSAGAVTVRASLVMVARILRTASLSPMSSRLDGAIPRGSLSALLIRLRNKPRSMGLVRKSKAPALNA
jgi:rod shape determining protein RodA